MMMMLLIGRSHFLPKEPLVPHAMWGWFARAAEIRESEDAEKAVETIKKYATFAYFYLTRD